MDIRKVLVFSALIAMNVLVWYEVFGVGFLVVLGVAVAMFALFGNKK